jgi:signal transduction histidine kinase
MGPAATVGYVPTDSPLEWLPRLLAFAERKRLGFTIASTVVVIAVVVLLVVVQLEHSHGPGLNLSVLVCVPVFAFGRRWPLPILALASAAAAAQVALGAASLLVSLVLGVAGYSVAVGLPRRSSIRAVIVAAAVFGVALLYAETTSGHSLFAVAAVEGFLPLAAGWFIGDSVAARRRYLAGLAEQAERERAAEAERARQEIIGERVRIARELHDVVAHTLAVMTVQAGVGRRLMAKRPEQATAALESIELIGRTAQDELRVVLGLLRDEHAGSAALVPAPRLADLKELADTVRASGTPVELRTSGTDRQLSPALELTLYRVVQEALTNVVRHAPQARATVDVTIGAARVRIEVTDDAGPAPPTAGEQGRPGLSGPGHGIVGMRERIGAFGGWLVAERVAAGFRVLAEVPLESAAGGEANQEVS